MMEALPFCAFHRAGLPPPAGGGHCWACICHRWLENGWRPAARRNPPAAAKSPRSHAVPRQRSPAASRWPRSPSMRDAGCVLLHEALRVDPLLPRMDASADRVAPCPAGREQVPLLLIAPTLGQPICRTVRLQNRQKRPSGGGGGVDLHRLSALGVAGQPPRHFCTYRVSHCSQVAALVVPASLRRRQHAGDWNLRRRSAGGGPLRRAARRESRTPLPGLRLATSARLPIHDRPLPASPIEAWPPRLQGMEAPVSRQRVGAVE